MDQECTRCKRSFDSSMDYEKHIKSNRCKEPYECESCNYITNRKSSYDNHLKSKKCKENSRMGERKKTYTCPQCNKPFIDNYHLSRHLNRKNSCNPSIEIIQLKHKKDTFQYSYIYLIQDRTSVALDNGIYKIGKTKQKNFARLNTYPKGYRIILFIACSNCDTLESSLIELFKKKYKQVLDYGNEYFQGNEICMMRDIFANVC